MSLPLPDDARANGARYSADDAIAVVGLLNLAALATGIAPPCLGRSRTSTTAG